MDEATLSARPGRSLGTCSSIQACARVVASKVILAVLRADMAGIPRAIMGIIDNGHSLVPVMHSTASATGMCSSAVLTSRHLRHRRLDEGVVQRPVPGASTLHKPPDGYANFAVHSTYCTAL